MKSSVLDSYAILAFLFQERGYKKVLAAFDKASESDQKLLIVAPNWAEVRYIVERKIGQSKWSAVRTKLIGLPLEIIPADQSLAELAGELKAFHKMSLADCFAAALAKLRNITVYTGDPEFKAVEKEIGILWL